MAINLAQAISIAKGAHADQLDKAGEKYINHVYRVAESLDDEWLRTLAWLHDIVEDTKYTMEDLRVLGADDSQIFVLEALTRKEGQTYADYIEAIEYVPAAVRIKLADLHDNMTPSRVRAAGTYWLVVERYLPAYKRLVSNDYA